MLQSPRVLYRSELGKADGAGKFKLTPYEVASALSYTFTGGPPDAALHDGRRRQPPVDARSDRGRRHAAWCFDAGRQGQARLPRA